MAVGRVLLRVSWLVWFVRGGHGGDRYNPPTNRSTHMLGCYRNSHTPPAIKITCFGVVQHEQSFSRLFLRAMLVGFRMGLGAEAGGLGALLLSLGGDAYSSPVFYLLA